MSHYEYVPDPYLSVDRQTLRPIGSCGICCDELYVGDLCYRLDGRLICEICLPAYARRYFAGCRCRLQLPLPEAVL